MSGSEVAVDRIRLGQGAILGQHVADRIIDTTATDILINLLVIGYLLLGSLIFGFRAMARSRSELRAWLIQILK